jgi:hypothetical protein
MNIIYLECKLLDITKRRFDFIGMSAAACGGALCFLPCSIQMTVGASSIQMKNNSHFSLESATKCCNKYFFVVFSQI